MLATRKINNSLNIVAPWHCRNCNRPILKPQTASRSCSSEQKQKLHPHRTSRNAKAAYTQNSKQPMMAVLLNLSPLTPPHLPTPDPVAVPNLLTMTMTMLIYVLLGSRERTLSFLLPFLHSTTCHSLLIDQLTTSYGVSIFRTLSSRINISRQCRRITI